MTRTSRLLLAVALVFGAAAALAVQLTEEQRQQIEERIKPVGELCLEDDTDCGGPATAAADTGGAARSGEAVYNAACMACHATGAGGAPLLGDADAWADRIAKGMDALYESGLQGVPDTTMMAKGGCMNCSDEEIRAAVDYMVEQSD